MTSTGWSEGTQSQTAWWQVDLGAVVPLTTIHLQSQISVTNANATTSWDLQLSSDGNTFGDHIMPGACVWNGSCQSMSTVVLPPSTSARFVRFNCLQENSVCALAEFEVYSSNYTVSFLDENTAKFCNYTGINRDMAFVVWH